MDPFQSMYTVREEKEYFGENFLFKGKQYPSHKKVLIVETKTCEDVLIRVYCMAWPARFWFFEITKKDKVHTISTGSGNWKRYQVIYELLKEGMIGVN